MPEANFNSINFSSVTNLTPSISIEASDGAGMLTGFGFPSPGYSPVVITLMLTPSTVDRNLFGRREMPERNQVLPTLRGISSNHQPSSPHQCLQLSADNHEQTKQWRRSPHSRCRAPQDPLKAAQVFC